MTGPLMVCGVVAVALVVCLLIDKRDERARKRRAAEELRERQLMGGMIEDVRRWDR